LELLREAAKLEDRQAQHLVGRACGEHDWQRFFWWGRAAARGYNVYEFREHVAALLPSFEKGELGRVLHVVCPVIRKGLEAAKQKPIDDLQNNQLQRVLELHGAMLGRAREPSRAGALLRCGAGW
jgi:hypothetical protein